MELFSRVKVFIYVSLFILILCACNHETSTVETTAPLEGQETTMTAPIEDADPFANYQYQYEDGRNRKWEEDIVYLAETFLNHHPTITDTYYFEARHYGRYDASYLVNDNQQYDESRRTLFVQEMKSLIDRIPELEDREIPYEMRRMVALLEDAHSSVTLSSDGYFPIVVAKLEKAGQLQYYALRLPLEYESLIYSQLISINGVALDDVINRLRPYVSSENIYWEERSIMENDWNSLFIQRELLQYVGVVPQGATQADFEFRLADGSTQTITLSPMTPQTYDPSQMALFDFQSRGLHQFQREENYWYQYIPEENLFYIRVRVCREMNEYAFHRFCSDVINELHNAEQPMRVAFDFRGNTGGSYPMSGFEAFAEYFPSIPTESCHILIDHAVFSSGNGMVGKLAESLPDAVLVGAPTGQPANCWGNPSSYSTPNFGVRFRLAKEFWMFAETAETDAIMPNIIIYQTLEDYINGVDTVLTFALASGNL